MIAGPDPRGDRRPAAEEKALGGDAERGVVMNAAPTAALIVSETEFLLEVLVVAFDPPARLRKSD